MYVLLRGISVCCPDGNQCMLSWWESVYVVLMGINVCCPDGNQCMLS